MKILLTALVFVGLLVASVIAAPFCSTYCAATGCTGTTADTCTSCATNWVTSGSTCAPATGFTLIDKTTDISGSMVFNPLTTTTANSYTYFGNIGSAATITVTLTAGMTQPHFSIELDCWMVALNGGSWSPSNKFSFALGGGSTQTRTINTKDTSQNLLGLGNNQHFFRISETFAHAAVSTQIKFTVSSN